MELTETMIAAALGAGAVMSVAALVVAGLALRGQRRVRRAYRVFSQGSQEDVLSLLQRHVAEVEGLRVDVGELRGRTEHLRSLVAGCVSRVSTVRYDAFDDMGGHLSYSTALLDERGDGVVLTSIHGRADTRTYAKPVERGSSRHTLSAEEESVIAEAMEEERRPRPHALSGQSRDVS